MRKVGFCYVSLRVWFSAYNHRISARIPAVKFLFQAGRREGAKIYRVGQLSIPHF